jgi:hypothetical protein
MIKFRYSGVGPGFFYALRHSKPYFSDLKAASATTTSVPARPTEQKSVNSSAKAWKNMKPQRTNPSTDFIRPISIVVPIGPSSASKPLKKAQRNYIVI